MKKQNLKNPAKKNRDKGVNRENNSDEESNENDSADK